MQREECPPGVGAIQAGSVEEVGLALGVGRCRGVRPNERKEDTV